MQEAPTPDEKNPTTNPDTSKRGIPRRSILKGAAGLGAMVLGIGRSNAQRTLDGGPEMPLISDMMDVDPGTKEDRLRLVGELLERLKSGPTYVRPADQSQDRSRNLSKGTTVVSQYDDETYFSTPGKNFWKDQLSASINITQYKASSQKELPAFDIVLQIRRDFPTDTKGSSKADAPLSIKWSSDTDVYRFSVDHKQFPLADGSQEFSRLKDMSRRFRAEITPTPEEKNLLDRLLKGLLLKILSLS